MTERDPIDYSLLGSTLFKPSTGETAAPKEVLAGKVVSLAQERVRLILARFVWMPCKCARIRMLIAHLYYLTHHFWFLLFLTSM